MIPLAPYVWIIPEIREPVTGSGILLSTFIPRPDTGVVKHIGKYCDLDLLRTEDGHTLQPGDRVSFDPDHIRRSSDGEEDCIIIPDRNVIALIPKEASVKVEDYELR
jgi:hypothetical protein